MIFFVLLLLVLWFIMDNPHLRNLVAGGVDSNVSKFIPQTKIFDDIFRLSDKYGLSALAKSEYRDNKMDEGSFIDRLIDNCDIDKQKYNKFVDLCSNPGSVSLKLLSICKQNSDDAHGFGISLPIDKGGYKLDDRLKRPDYTLVWADILEKLEYKEIDKVDCAYCACFIRHNKGKENMVKDLYVNSYWIACSKLKLGGDLIILLSFQWDVELLLNTVQLLGDSFNDIILYKDKYYTPGLSIIFVVCKNYKQQIDDDIALNYKKKNIYTQDTLRKYSKSINDALKIMNCHLIGLVQ